MVKQYYNRATFSTFPYIPRKASFQEKSFITKVLDTTPKIPISIPLARSFPRKIGKRSNSISISTFEVTSALNPTENQAQYLYPVQHFPLHSAKSSIPRKELLYKGLGHRPQFLLFFPLARSAALDQDATLQAEIVNEVRLKFCEE